MDKQEMEKLRQKLNQMAISMDVDWDDLLKLSQEMDLLIIEYFKKQMEARNEGRADGDANLIRVADKLQNKI